jgi:hypothetical protein
LILIVANVVVPIESRVVAGRCQAIDYRRAIATRARAARPASHQVIRFPRRAIRRPVLGTAEIWLTWLPR